ncbi:hypothetical protein [Chryseolinea sp. H1M3-3]|uniref:hypothetical protein n=1 Tax=Chryseolinea sp. H1M3-3 TaxID=3034144 RepID=UPI0023ED4042|nr:hypothetical protein [Chryseolinea sp. H1M3-3]
MAIIKENDLTEGMSGKFGKKIVFRVVRGVTIATRRSTSEQVLSVKQIAHRERFGRATEYAKVKMQDPVAKAAYQQMAGDKPFSSALSEAVSDYLIPPKILDVRITAFAGSVGSTISVVVFDNLKTIRVTITVMDGDRIIDAGDAEYQPGTKEWTYVTTQPLPAFSGIKIIATAINRPGNETIFEKSMDKSY